MRLLSSLSLALVMAAGPVCRADTPAQKPVTVPFEMLVTRHMAMQIKVNGKGPYRVIFDTGAPISSISSKVAKESGARVAVHSLACQLVRRVQPTGTKSIASVAWSQDVPVIVMDRNGRRAPQFSGRSKDRRFPFLCSLRMDARLPGQGTTFVPNGYEPRDDARADDAQRHGRQFTRAARLSPSVMESRSPRTIMTNQRGEGCEVNKDGPAAKAGLQQRPAPGSR